MGKQSNKSILGLISFVVMLISSALFLLMAIFNLVGINTGNSIFHALELIVKCCMYFVIAVVAHWYVKKQDKIWQIIYWIIVICFIVFVILGIVNL